MKKSYVLITGAIVFVAILNVGYILSLSTTLHAATFNVSSGDTAGLIDAINTSNLNGEDDTINLKAGTYTLVSVDNDTDSSNGLPSISSKIMIRGAGAEATTIERVGTDSTPDFRIFHVASVGELTLEDLTVKNGSLEVLEDLTACSGGGIRNYGILTMTDCTISDNVAYCDGGGIFNSSTLTMSNCTMSGNIAQGPGGIFNSGTATMSNCTISDNREHGIENRGTATMTLTGCTISGGSDGGIVNTGKVTLNMTNCTISGNETGISIHGTTLILTNSTVSGNRITGIVSLHDSTTTMTNCTISGNGEYSSGSGGIENYSPASMTMTNCTISGNKGGVTGPGGIWNTGTVNLKNSIVANNPFGDCNGIITSFDHNIDSDGTCGVEKTADPLLGSLQNNGGLTETHALLSGSPAIDAGNPEYCLSTDQRNYQRPIDGDSDSVAICDIGAYEFNADKEILVVNDSLTFVPDPSSYRITDSTGCPSGFAGTFSFDAKLTNIGSNTLSDLVAQVVELTEGNQLKNTDNDIKSAGATINVDTTLNPSDSTDVTFEICLKERKPFCLLLDVVKEVLPE